MPEELDIRKIKEGLPGITKIAAGQLYEACMVCLHRSGHPQNVIMPLKGDNEKEYEILWEDYFDDQIDRTYKDQEYTTEHGAVCISAMLAIHETDYTIIERSRKGTGVDYWLGHDDDIPLKSRPDWRSPEYLQEEKSLLKQDSKKRLNKRTNQTLRSYLHIYQLLNLALQLLNLHKRNSYGYKNTT